MYIFTHSGDLGTLGFVQVTPPPKIVFKGSSPRNNVILGTHILCTENFKDLIERENFALISTPRQESFLNFCLKQEWYGTWVQLRCLHV